MLETELWSSARAVHGSYPLSHFSSTLKIFFLSKHTNPLIFGVSINKEYFFENVWGSSAVLTLYAEGDVLGFEKE